jgi:hypothetical protein
VPHHLRIAAVAAIAATAVLAVAVAPRLAQGQSDRATVTLGGPTSVSTSAGNVQVPVNVKDAANLAGFQFVLSVDPNLLQPVSVDKTDFLTKSGRELVCQDPTIDASAVRFTCVTLRLDPAGVDGAGTIALVTLKPKQDGTSPLKLSHVKLVHPDASELPSQTVDGKLTVGGSGGWFTWWIGVLIAAGVVAIVVPGVIVLWRSRRQARLHEHSDIGSGTF